jgi:hypothetical protein
VTICRGRLHGFPQPCPGDTVGGILPAHYLEAAKSTLDGAGCI